MPYRQGTRNEDEPLTLFFSSISSLNSAFAQYLRVPVLRSLEVDYNFDHITDRVCASPSLCADPCFPAASPLPNPCLLLHTHTRSAQIDLEAVMPLNTNEKIYSAKLLTFFDCHVRARTLHLLLLSSGPKGTEGRVQRHRERERESKREES